MDLGTALGIATAVLMLLFIGVWVWAWSKKRRAAFDEAAQIPLHDEEPPPQVADSSRAANQSRKTDS